MLPFYTSMVEYGSTQFHIVQIMLYQHICIYILLKKEFQKKIQLVFGEVRMLELQLTLNFLNFTIFITTEGRTKIQLMFGRVRNA